MSKRVILTISSGSFESGFSASLRIREDNNPPKESQYEGELAPAPDIPNLFSQWQQAFSNKTEKTRIKPLANNSSISYSCKRTSNNLKQYFNTWLNSPASWLKIRDGLYKNLNPKDEIRFIIQTKNEILQKLPWHLWDFFNDYRQAEVAIASNSYETVEKPLSIRKKPRILAILGDDSKGINVNADREYLDSLQKLNTETVFCVKPQYREFERLIWDENGWNILFFAGHSSTEEGIGRISINENESIEITDLKYALQRAISQGLQIAIFNSCDGLGIANSLVELNIPQIIVMRYPVPNQVAQEFLLNFLQAFTGGKSLYASVREAREKLQGLEVEIPCASWIPILYQNPAVVPLTWRELGGISSQGENNLASERGIDYTHLRNLLLAGNWKEADSQTCKIMLEISQREKKGWLDDESILNLPCQDLRTINALWLKYSNGRFGFSVQKQIWQDINESSLVAFGDRVGWRVDGNWLIDYHSDFNFSLDAPVGHLPCFATWCDGWIWGEMWQKELGSSGRLTEVFLTTAFNYTSFLVTDWSSPFLESARRKSISALVSKLESCQL